PNYLDGRIALRHTYYYSVTAVDSAGNEGEPSSQVHFLYTDITPPQPPSGLKAFVENRIVHLSWTAPPDRDLLGYRISRAYSDSTFFPIRQDMIRETFIEDPGPVETGLEPGRRYFYSVKAVDSLYYDSDPAGIWIAVPDDRPPSPPGQVTVKNVLGRHLEVSWNASPSGDVEKYRLMRRIEDDEKDLGTFGKLARAYTDRQVQKGRSAVYIVTAVDTAGNESAPSKSHPERLRDFSPPPGPRYVAAYLLEQGVRVKWDPIGSYDLSGYNVYRSDLPTGIGIKVNTEPLQAVEMLDEQGSSASWYWVKAVDTSGNESEKSRAVSPETKK
ncbi:hypothetical protein JW906_15520, partial [bacterium]|nr:hypothetical protein [bacterium]